MKRIAIITWRISSNYGTCLQAYALSKYISAKGYDAYFLTNMRFIMIKDMFISIRYLGKKFILLLKKKKEEKLYASIIQLYTSQLKIKDQRLSEFEKVCYKLENPRNNKEFRDLEKGTYAFLTGSDQIWNPNYLSGAFLLNFVSNNTKKIAYASSLGVNSIPRMLRKVYKKNLSRFHALSVRESDASVLLEQMLNRPVKTMLDPVFLLDADEWENFAEHASINSDLPYKYVMQYFVGSDINYHDSVNEICNVLKSEKLTLACTPAGLEDDGYVFAQAGPFEFVKILIESEMVCTDSFHAVAMSINLNKQFVVYKRFLTDTGDSQNDRIYSILHMFGLENRLLDSMVNIHEILNHPINYFEINSKLKEKKTEAYQFLREALQDEE